MPLFSNDIAGHSVVHHWNNLSKYHLSRLSSQGTTEPWPQSTEICCWHCTEPFDGQPIGIPLKYDPNGTIVCDGNFCSYGCALTHVFTHRTSFREYQTKLMLLQVAREVHGIEFVVPAPPPLALQKFGGHLSIDEFRSVTTQHSVVVNPPFVSQDIVCEEHDAPSAAATGDCVDTVVPCSDTEHNGSWQVTNLSPPTVALSSDDVLCESEPLGPPLYDNFVKSQQQKTESPDAPAASSQTVGGALGRFIKQPKGKKRTSGDTL